MRWEGDGDRVVAIQNGRGARTSVRYRARESAHLPARFDASYSDGRRTDRRCRRTDTHQGADPVELCRCALVQPRGADPRLRARAVDPGRSVIVSRNDMSDACGARPATEVEDLAGRVFRRSRQAFADPGAQAPFTCLPRSTVEAECGRRTPCQLKRTSYSYDTFGNADIVRESRRGGRRRTLRPVHPNDSSYISTGRGRPAPSLGSWGVASARQDPVRLRRRLLRASACRPRRSHARERLLRSWTRRGVGHVLRLRRPGQPLPHGDPPVSYDDRLRDRRHLFPTSACQPEPIGCTTTVWDERLGVPRTVTDPNKQTTTTDYDPYGRVTYERKPDGETTTTQYLATGTVSDPSNKDSGPAPRSATATPETACGGTRNSSTG